MTDYPIDFVAGQEAEADDLNLILAARYGDILPIDPTTRNFTDDAGGLGDPTRRFSESEVDNIKIDGNTISSTNTDGDINITPNGNGETVIANLDSTPIGANTASTGDFTTITGTSIATDGKEALKMDIITGTQIVDISDSASVTVAHGKGNNIRGACVAAYDASAGAATDYRAIIDSAGGVNETNVIFTIYNSYSSSALTVSYAVTVFYV